MTLDRVLWECFRHFVHLDYSNASIHTAPARFSPITFRLAEQLQGRPWDEGDTDTVALLSGVLDHLGRYEEDRGR